MAIWAQFFSGTVIIAAVSWAPGQCESSQSDIHKNMAKNLTSFSDRIEILEETSKKCCNGGQQCPFAFVDRADNGDKLTVPGGYVITDKDVPATLFVCCANINGSLFPGQALIYERKPLIMMCNIPYEGKQIKFLEVGSYQVLVSPNNYNFRWVKRTPEGTLPRNAIIGGQTADSTILYIARCKVHNDPGRDYGIGWLAANDTNILKYSLNGVPYACTDYEVLECSQQ